MTSSWFTVHSTLLRAGTDWYVTWHFGVIKWKLFSLHWSLWGESIARKPVDSPHKCQWRDDFFDLHLNKWFETPSRSLWGRCNDFTRILQGYFIGKGTFLWLFQGQWGNFDEYGLMHSWTCTVEYTTFSLCVDLITTTKQRTTILCTYIYAVWLPCITAEATYKAAIRMGHTDATI